MEKLSKISLGEQWKTLIEKRGEIEKFIEQGESEGRIKIRKTYDPTQP